MRRSGIQAHLLHGSAGSVPRSSGATSATLALGRFQTPSIAGVSAGDRYNVRISTVPHMRIAWVQPAGMKTARPVGIIHEDWPVETVIAPEVA